MQTRKIEMSPAAAQALKDAGEDAIYILEHHWDGREVSEMVPDSALNYFHHTTKLGTELFFSSSPDGGEVNISLADEGADQPSPFGEVIFVYTTDQAIEDGILTQIASETPEPLKRSRFPLGRLVATPGALQALRESMQNAVEFLARHGSGDWGEVCEEDRQENELSLKEGFRILSAYRTKLGEKIWVITEADRSVTTILLPEEY